MLFYIWYCVIYAVKIAVFLASGHLGKNRDFHFLLLLEV